jgi:DNA repair exonuclease SbcCD nuclease subunit
MRVIHVSDTHLGYGDFYRADPHTGINQREQDVYDAFAQVIAAIRENPPDLVVHAGDLFDTVRPSNRAIDFALKEIAKLSQAGIPFVAISGNHSTPRVANAGSIFGAFEVLPNVFPVFHGQYQILRIGRCAVHCLPHPRSGEEMDAAVRAMKADARAQFNLILSHAGVMASADTIYRMGEFNETILSLPVLATKKGFDGVCLGHYHKFLDLGHGVRFSGSTERFSFREAEGEKGFLELDLVKRTARFVPIRTRAMRIFPPLDGQALSAREMENRVESWCRSGIKDQVVLFTFQNMRRQKYAELDLHQMKEWAASALHAKFSVENWLTEEGKTTLTTIGSLPVEFERFLQRQETGEWDKARLLDLGRQYLAQAQEQEEVEACS